MTGQVNLDGYIDAGVIASVEFVNELAVKHARGKPASSIDPVASIRRVLEVDPLSVAQLRTTDAPAFTKLALQLKEVFDDLGRDDVDNAASKLNRLLALHPAHPHLAKENGTWRLHHHPANAHLVPMWTAICAEAMARMIGTGHANRFGACQSNDCDCVFFDTSKNGSRRFCTTTCQNRTKTAMFRKRHAI